MGRTDEGAKRHYPSTSSAVRALCAVRAVPCFVTSIRVKGKADDLYCGSMQFEDHRRTALEYPLVHWALCRCQQYGAFSMKTLARYQIILLGEQRHIGVNNLPRVVARIMPRSESNPRPLDHESNALPLHHRVSK